jgi:hypothetical protein
MCASLGVADSYCSNTFHRWFCVNRAVVMEDTTMSMIGVFAQADVACDIQGRIKLSKLLDGEYNGTLGVVCWGAFSVLW